VRATRKEEIPRADAGLIASCGLAFFVIRCPAICPTGLARSPLAYSASSISPSEFAGAGANVPRRHAVVRAASPDLRAAGGAVVVVGFRDLAAIQVGRRPVTCCALGYQRGSRFRTRRAGPDLARAGKR
jgi:hypothetical protein